MKKLGIAMLALVFLWACSGGSGGGHGPDGNDEAVTYTENPDIFTKEPDPETIHVVSFPTGDVQIPVTLIVFSFDDTVDADGAREVIESLGGVMTGQIPVMRIYQGEFTGLSNYIDLENKLDAIRSMAIPGLLGVSIDAYAEPLDGGVADSELEASSDLALENCRVTDDNMWIGPKGRCPFENAEYFQLIAIMDYLKDDVTKNRVRVGVMDTGLNQAFGEFDDIPIINIDAPGQTATDRDTKLHGTKVTSIIAADDDGEGMNGIASKVLGTKLVIGSTTFHKTISGQLATLAQMAENGFSIVNMSFGYVKSKYTGDDYAELRATYKRGLAALPNVLFVTAAANDPFELTRDNDCPAGFDLSNVITVGGLSACEIDEPYDDSSYGDLIDMAAPAVRVPCVSLLGRNKVAGSVGNSFAAPQVTAVAAILKSIDPSLTPATLKSYIQDNCLGTTAHVGSRRLVYAMPVMQLLTDNSTSDIILDLVDRDEDGESDPSGIIVNRICSGIEYRVSSDWGASFNGTYRFEGDEEENAGVLMGSETLSTWMIGSADTDEPPFLSLSCMGSGFAVFGHSYAVDQSGSNVSLNFQPDEEHALVTGKSGTVYFDNCQVIQRYGLGDFESLEGIPGLDDMGNTPALIEVEGRFQAVGETLTESGWKDLSFSGTFVTPLAIPLVGVDQTLIDYIEENCLCGSGAN